MFVLVGWGIALVCIFGVYIVHGGNIGVILKALPFELITIFGAAGGAFLEWLEGRELPGVVALAQVRAAAQ